MVAAELDCKNAEKAAQDLIRLERTRQLGDVYPGQPFMTKDFNGKLEKLSKIAKECPAPYRADGIWGPTSLSGLIDTRENPFTLSVGGNCTGKMTFSGGPNSGKIACAVTCGGVPFEGSGSYSIAYTGEGGKMTGNCDAITHSPLDVAEDYPVSVTLHRVQP